VKKVKENHGDRAPVSQRKRGLPDRLRRVFARSAPIFWRVQRI